MILVRTSAPPLAVLLMLAAGQMSLAADPTPTATSEPSPTATDSSEMKALKEQTTLKEQQAKLAQAEASIVKAQAEGATAQKSLGGGTFDQPKNTITTDSMYEPTLLAHEQLTSLGTQIAKRLSESGNKNYVLYTEQLVASLQGYRTIRHVLSELGGGYDALLASKEKLTELGKQPERQGLFDLMIAPGAPAALSTLPTTLATLFDALSLLGSDVTLKGEKDASPDQFALEAEVGRALSAYPGVHLYDPSVVPMLTQGHGQLFDDLSAVTEAQARAAIRLEAETDANKKAIAKHDKCLLDAIFNSLLTDLGLSSSIAQCDAASDAAKGTPTPKSTTKTGKNAQGVGKPKKENDGTSGDASSAATQASAASDSGAQSSHTPAKADLAQLLESGAEIDELLSDEGAFLKLKLLSTGGSTRTKRNVFTLFTGPWVSFTGGAVAAFAAYDTNGAITGSGVATTYSGYRKPTQR